MPSSTRLERFQTADDGAVQEAVYIHDGIRVYVESSRLSAKPCLRRTPSDANSVAALQSLWMLIPDFQVGDEDKFIPVVYLHPSVGVPNEFANFPSDVFVSCPLSDFNFLPCHQFLIHRVFVMQPCLLPTRHSLRLCAFALNSEDNHRVPRHQPITPILHSRAPPRTARRIPTESRPSRPRSPA